MLKLEETNESKISVKFLFGTPGVMVAMGTRDERSDYIWDKVDELGVCLGLSHLQNIQEGCTSWSDTLVKTHWQGSKHTL